MVGQTLGHYRIVEKIGGGGMGVVYRAHDDRLERDVAVKVLPPGTLNDEAARKRFRAEALALSRFNHPNIASVFDFDTVGDTDFIVMELVKGQTLSELAHRTPLLEAEVLAAGIQIGQALEEAHEHGVIHRDLKPANVMLTSKGQVKVLDFGLAKYLPPVTEATASASLTQERAVGTLPYMSPEQLRGQKVDERSDVYALGMVLYETSTAHRPFDQPVPTALADGILHQPPPPPGRLNPKLSSRLEEIILKCLEKSPADRYQSAKDLGIDLRRLKRDSESGSSSTVAPALAPRARRPWLLISGAAALLLLLAVGVLIWRRQAAPAKARAAGKQTAVAVLPFQNAGADSGHDFLRFAMADEVVNTLSHVPALAVRPFSITRKYAGEKTDPLAAARELGVADIITGDYSLQGAELHVTVEAIDVETNSLLWHKTVSGPANDAIPLQQQLSSQVSQELVPALGVSAGPARGGSQPRNKEAYDLYQRSLAISRDAGPNAQGISLLERSLQLDPDYAPAWVQLGRRLYDDGEYGNGGQAAVSRSTECYQRAVELDPDLLEPAAQLIDRLVELGRLETAFDEANGLVKRHPQSGYAHRALAYVLRYGGMLEESIGEYTAAAALDPVNDSSRAIVYILVGQYDRVTSELAAAPQTEFVRSVMSDAYLRQGKFADALRIMPENPAFGRFLLEPCIEKRPLAEIMPLLERYETGIIAVPDSEPKYFQGAWDAYCGAPQNALRMLKLALDQGYCSSFAADADPLYRSAREMPGFKAIMRDAHACRDRFVAHRAQVLAGK